MSDQSSGGQADLCVANYWFPQNPQFATHRAKKGAALRDLRKSLAWAAARPLGLKIE
jgi:hypothetical protein